MEWLIGLLSGAVGGNLGGAILKKFSLGTLWNSVVGVLGGGLGHTILGAFGADVGGNVAGPLAAGTVGGGGLLAIIGAIKGMLGKK